MSKELKPCHVMALGNLSPSTIGGEKCEGCKNDIGDTPYALLSGSEEALRSCAVLLFEDCEVVPIGTLARIKELEEVLRWAEDHMPSNTLDREGKKAYRGNDTASANYDSILELCKSIRDGFFEERYPGLKLDNDVDLGSAVDVELAL